MSNSLKIFFITLLTIIIIGVTIVFVLLMNGKIAIHSFESKIVYDENITEPFNIIDIKTNSMDITLNKSNDNVTNVKVYNNDKNNITISVLDNKLLINEEDNEYNWNMLFGKRELIVSLPEKEYDLIVNSTSGDIESTTNLNNVDITTTSGDMEMKEINNLKIKSTSGDIEIEKINNSLNIETVSGDIDIDELYITNNSNIKVTSGDVTINKSSNNIYYNTNVAIGDVKIDNNNRHAEYEMNINSNTGDIKVLQTIN